MLRKWSISILVVIVLCLSTTAFARPIVPAERQLEKCILPALSVNERPGPADRPTEVKVGLRLLDITVIEDTSQTITADFFVSLTWTDPRLADFEGCQFSMDDVWMPQIDYINAGRLFTRLRKQVDVNAAGQVRYLQRFQGTFVFPYDAHKFPFDRHNIILSLLSVEYGEKDVRLVVDEKFTGRKSDEFNIPDWIITKVGAEIVSRPIVALQHNASIFAFSISAQRRAEYYIWKVILPLTLIVIMSWSVFWIDPTQLGPQLGMSATSMLTLIAFQFAMANILPRLSYYTLLDKFIVGSTALVFISLIESVTTTHLTSIEKRKYALGIDQICRWLFPIVFVIFSITVFWH